MRNMTRALPLLFVMICCVLQSNAQLASEKGSKLATLRTGIMYGKVVNQESQKPLEAVSIQFLEERKDNATGRTKDVVLATSLSSKRGEFM